MSFPPPPSTDPLVLLPVHRASTRTSSIAHHRQAHLERWLWSNAWSFRRSSTTQIHPGESELQGRAMAIRARSLLPAPASCPSISSLSFVRLLFSEQSPLIRLQTMRAEPYPLPKLVIPARPVALIRHPAVRLPGHALPGAGHRMLPLISAQGYSQ